MLLTEKETKVFIPIILYVSVFLMFFFVFYGFKTINNDVCTSNVVSNELGNTALVIADQVNYTIPVPIPNKYYNGLSGQSVCLKAVGSTGTYNTLEHREAEIYVNNGTEGLTCFNNINSLQRDYMTFKCVDCDSTNNISITLSEENAITIINGLATNTKNWFYKVFNHEYCQELYKTVLNVYFAIIGLLVGIALMIRGVNWFGKWITKGLF